MDFAGMLRAARLAAASGPDRAPSCPTGSGVNLGDPADDVRVFERIEALPDEVRYCPRFVSEEEAQALEQQVQQGEFVQLNGRLLQNFGGVPSLSEGGTIVEPMPQFLEPLCEALVRRGAFQEKPDQALINKYEPGQGIGIHADGPTFRPRAAILSLKSSAILHFHKPESLAIVGSVLLEPRSLLVFSGQAFEAFKHSIAAVTEEDASAVSNANFVDLTDMQGRIRRGQRISITLRNVALIRCKVDPVRDYIPEDLRAEMERRNAWWRRAIGS